MSMKKSVKSFKGIKGVKGEKLIALAVFVVLGIVALQIPVNNLAGSGARFTLFDLIAPTGGAFLGSWLGVVAVFLMGVVNLIFGGVVDRGAIIRLFPVLFGVWFFAKRDVRFLIVPMLAMISFNLNEVGRSVWYYSLFWTIPVLVYPVVKKSLVARALASTFVAHSVGGAIWIWAFNMPASVWQVLIPVVALERSIMALGICASYILMNNVLVVLQSRNLLRKVGVDKKYVFGSTK